jgi:hypothetical protein
MRICIYGDGLRVRELLGSVWIDPPTYPISGSIASVHRERGRDETFIFVVTRKGTCQTKPEFLRATLFRE